MKPQIYKTGDDELIVQDELLNFFAVKIKTMCQDELGLLASSHFNSQWIESSRKVLFELCPHTKRYLTFKVNQKYVNNIKSCLKLPNECGEDIPLFVSHFLDELPPLTFKSMDISSFLSKMEHLHTEICPLRQAVKLQGDVGEDLHIVTSTIHRRVGVVEQHVVAYGGERAAWTCLRQESPVQVCTLQLIQQLGGSLERSRPLLTSPTGHATHKGCAGRVEARAEKNIEGTVSLSNSMKWSLVVKSESHST